MRMPSQLINACINRESSMAKKRAEWNVKLVQSNYKMHTQGELKPQVMLNQTYDLDGLVDRIRSRGGCALSRENLKHAASLLMNEVEDCLLEGSAVNLPIGRLSPGLTGMWETRRRYDETVRDMNKAVVNYSMSPGMRRALDRPLLTVRATGGGRRLMLSDVTDRATGAVNSTLTPGGVAVVRGMMLLMNGELPERGVYLLDSGHGSTAAYIAPDELLYNSRNRLMFRVPATLPAGRYRLRVVSQCTTNPHPMKEARTCELACELSVGAGEGGD